MLFHVITHTNELLPKMNHVVATPGPHKAQPKCNVVWSFSAALRCTLKVLNLNDTSETAPNQNVRPQRSSVNSLTDDGCQHLSCSILADLGSADSRKGIPGELLHRSCALPIFQFKHCLELKHCRQVRQTGTASREPTRTVHLPWTRRWCDPCGTQPQCDCGR